MAYETVGDLIKVFREDEKDLAIPPLWSDSQLLRFAEESLTAFADQTKSIIDDGVEIDFIAGEDQLPYVEQIIDVLDAELVIGERSWGLEVKSPAEVKRSRSPYSGRPAVLVASSSPAKLRLVPKPKEAGLIRLTVIRRPMDKAVTKETKLTDINRAHRARLLLFIKHRAYNVKDAELFDGAKADGYLVEFNYECQRIYEDELRRRGGARTIRYQG